MKKTNVIYWILTGLFAAFMLFSSIGGVMNDPKTMEFMKMLGYPVYFTVFISWAKVLGVIAILVPGYPRIKEWAYAGLVFDLAGATWSIISFGGEGLAQGIAFMLFGFCLAFGSYIFHHKRLKTKTTAVWAEAA